MKQMKTGQGKARAGEGGKVEQADAASPGSNSAGTNIHGYQGRVRNKVHQSGRLSLSLSLSLLRQTSAHSQRLQNRGQGFSGRGSPCPGAKQNKTKIALAHMNQARSKRKRAPTTQSCSRQT